MHYSGYKIAPTFLGHNFILFSQEFIKEAINNPL